MIDDNQIEGNTARVNESMSFSRESKEFDQTRRVIAKWRMIRWEELPRLPDGSNSNRISLIDAN